MTKQIALSRAGLLFVVAAVILASLLAITSVKAAEVLVSQEVTLEGKTPPPDSVTMNLSVSVCTNTCNIIQRTVSVVFPDRSGKGKQVLLLTGELGTITSAEATTAAPESVLQ